MTPAYHPRMADYVTWEEVAEYVLGEARLKDILLPNVETADVHPWFAQQRAVAQRHADAALEKAGIETPLSAVTDAQFRNAVMGLMVGYLTQTNSAREPWMTDAFNAAVKYFEEVAEGAPVLGAVVAPADSSTTALIIGNGGHESAVFDYTQPDAEVLGVFASLGSGPRHGWRR